MIGMDQEIVIVTPKRQERARLMPSLASTLQTISGVRVIGQGETCVKITVAHPAEFRAALPSELRDACFIEQAVTFDLAGNN